MRTRAVLLSAVLGLVLAGCETEPSRSLHDLYLFGHLDTRITHFYGGEGAFTYEGRTVELSDAEATDRRFRVTFGVSSALLVDGSPFLRAAQTPLATAPTVLSRIPLTTDMQVRIDQPVGRIVYFDGSAYLGVSDGASEELEARVVPRPRFNRLRGLGEMTNQEADALADALEALDRPFAVTELPAASLPQRAVDGLAEQRRSGFYVQFDIPTDADAFVPPPSRLVWETLASGSQATAVREARFTLARDFDDLIGVWTAAHSSALQPPSVPPFSPERETLVAIFLGTRPTGGYAVAVRDVVEERGELYIDVELTEPGRDALTTQVITSPWTIVKVLRGGYQLAWIRDITTGELIGAARPGR